MNLAGHLINKPNRLEGDGNGLFYDYIAAHDGVYVQAENSRLAARILYLPGRIRGLAPLDEMFRLPSGKIPAAVMELGLGLMAATPEREVMFSIVLRDGIYRLELPEEQTGDAASLRYRRRRGASDDPIVAQFHSHSRGRAFFSRIDDADELGFAVYGVVGELHREEPELLLRTGIYGHYGAARWEEIFDRRPAKLRIREMAG